MDPTSPDRPRRGRRADRRPAAHRPGARRRPHGPLAVRGLDPRPRAHPPGPQRRRPVALVRSAVDGTGETMYASPEARDADIEAGADRSGPELRRRRRAHRRGLAGQLPRLGPGPGRAAPGAHARGCSWSRGKNIPFMRLREVVFHHVDLARRLRLRRRRPRAAAAAPRRGGAPAAAPATRLPTLTLPHARTATSGRSARARHPSSGLTGAPCLGWLGRGLTAGVAGDPLPRLPEGR